MSTIDTYVKNLDAERKRAWHEQKAVLDSAATQKRSLTADEQAVVARTDAEIDKLDAEIKGWLEKGKRTAAFDEVGEQLSRANDSQASRRDRQGHTADDRRFMAWLKDPNAGAVFEFDLSAEIDRRAQRIRGALGEDSATAGGNITQSFFVRRLYEYLEDYSGIRRTNATVVMAPRGPSAIVPKFGTYGTAVVVGEGTAIAGTDPTFGQADIEVWKYAHLCRVSNELLTDSVVDLADALARDLARSIGRKQDDDFTTGSGTSEATGAFTVMGTALTGANGGTGAPTFDNMIDLVYSVNSAYRRRGAQFVMRDSTAGFVRKLKDTEGHYVWQPNGAAGEPDTLLGYEVVTSDSVAALGTGRLSIAFGDWSAYNIIDVGTLRIDRSDDRYFDQDQVAYRGVLRSGGDLVDLTGAVKAYRGGTA